MLARFPYAMFSPVDALAGHSRRCFVDFRVPFSDANILGRIVFATSCYSFEEIHFYNQFVVAQVFVELLFN